MRRASVRIYIAFIGFSHHTWACKIVSMIFTLAPEGNTVSQGPQESQIRGILSITAAMFNFTFQQAWIADFLKLFDSKQQINIFFECFNEAYHYSMQQSHIQIEEEMQNKEILGTLDILELQHNQGPSNRPKQESKSEIITYQMSHTQLIPLLQHIIASSPYIKLQSIYQRLKQVTFKQPPSIQFIQKMLKSLNYRQLSLNKTSIDRNSMVNLQNRYKYCFEYHQLIQSKAKVLFIDVCQVDMNMGAEWAWFKDKQPVFQRTNDDYIQVIACLTQNESLTYDIEKRPKGDTANGASKVGMITNMINERGQQENMVIVIDSLSIPISKSIKRVVIRHNMRLFILPPLSPQLNPNHFFFRQLKASIRNNASNIISVDKLQQFVAKMCNQLKENRSYFEQMKGYLIKGLTKAYF